MLIDSWQVVEQFEKRMADYCGAPFAVAVDTCTTALFLCLKRLKVTHASIPCRTYLGVACSVLHSGSSIGFTDFRWEGSYSLLDTGGDVHIVDSACRLSRGMYLSSTLTCLSFQSRKHLKIGRGGMVLTDNKKHADWLRKARFCGRAEPNGVPLFVGWQAYMEPERAARGLTLMDSLPDYNADLVFEYPDLREFSVLRQESR